MINQNQDGFTWKVSGDLLFSGRKQSGKRLGNDYQWQTGEDGDWVIADAISFWPAGWAICLMMCRGRCSGYPRWEESGRYFAGFMGKSDLVNIQHRQRYAALCCLGA